MRRLGLGTLVLAGAALGLAPAAWAAPGWTSAADLTLPAGATAGNTQLGFASGGVATVAWLDSGGALHAGTIAPGDAYDEQLDAALPEPADAGTLRLAVAADGAAVVAWRQSAAAAGAYMAVMRTPAGSWSAPAALLPGGADADAIALGFDSSDDLAAAWESAGQVMASVEAGGAWGSVTTLDSSGNAGAPDLGVAPDGSEAVLYPSAGNVELATRPAGGSWSSPATMTPGSPLGIATTSGDTAYALVDDSDAGCVAAARSAVGAAPASPVCLTGGGVTATSGGVAVVGADADMAWSAAPGGPETVQGAQWPAAAGSPDAPVTLDGSAGAAGVSQVVGDEDGSGAALWAGSGGQLRAAAFDAGGPALMFDDVPATIAPRTPTAFSATFADLWSGVASITWTFGDGTPTLTGAEVAHAYATAGTYTVTSTATDGLGNATSQSFTITVQPPVAAQRRARARAARARHRHRARHHHHRRARRHHRTQRRSRAR